MGVGEWSFRTTDALVTVHADSIAVRFTPGGFLTGQLVRWRHGSPRERGGAALLVGAFVASFAGFVAHLYLIADAGLDWSSLAYATSVGVFGYSLWRNHGRTLTIPRSAIESVTLDEDSRQVTLTHGAGDGPLSVFRDDVTETTLTVGTDDGLRGARETLELRGVEVEPAPADAEITHRIVTANGGCYCERCGALVTPNDKVCRDCDYALWVERSSASD